MVVESGAVPALVALLRSASVATVTTGTTGTVQKDAVAEQAVWALGNIAGDATRYRDMVLEHGAVGAIVDLVRSTAALSSSSSSSSLSSSSSSSSSAYRSSSSSLATPALTTRTDLMRNVAWLLSNLCRGKPKPPLEAIGPALPLLAHLIRFHDDDEVVKDACWALSYVSDRDDPRNTRADALVKLDVCRRLVELLMHHDVNLVAAALRTVGNMASGSHAHTQVLIDSSVLPCLAALVVHPKRGLRKDACWMVSNIMAGTEPQLEAVLKQDGLMPRLVDALKSGEWIMQQEAVWAVSNGACTGNDEQIR